MIFNAFIDFPNGQINKATMMGRHRIVKIFEVNCRINKNMLLK